MVLIHLGGLPSPTIVVSETKVRKRDTSPKGVPKIQLEQSAEQPTGTKSCQTMRWVYGIAAFKEGSSRS